MKILKDENRSRFSPFNFGWLFPLKINSNSSITFFSLLFPSIACLVSTVYRLTPILPDSFILRRQSGCSSTIGRIVLCRYVSIRFPTHSLWPLSPYVWSRFQRNGNSFYALRFLNMFYYSNVYGRRFCERFLLCAHRVR